MNKWLIGLFILSAALQLGASSQSTNIITPNTRNYLQAFDVHFQASNAFIEQYRVNREPLFRDRFMPTSTQVTLSPEDQSIFDQWASTLPLHGLNFDESLHQEFVARAAFILADLNAPESGTDILALIFDIAAADHINLSSLSTLPEQREAAKLVSDPISLHIPAIGEWAYSAVVMREGSDPICRIDGQLKISFKRDSMAIYEFRAEALVTHLRLIGWVGSVFSAVLHRTLNEIERRVLEMQGITEPNCETHYASINALNTLVNHSESVEGLIFASTLIWIANEVQRIGLPMQFDALPSLSIQNLLRGASSWIASHVAHARKNRRLDNYFYQRLNTALLEANDNECTRQAFLKHGAERNDRCSVFIEDDRAERIAQAVLAEFEMAEPNVELIHLSN